MKKFLFTKKSKKFILVCENGDDPRKVLKDNIRRYPGWWKEHGEKGIVIVKADNLKNAILKLHKNKIDYEFEYEVL